MRTAMDTYMQSIHQRELKPIKYWEAYNGKLCVGWNNSVAILRAKFKGDKSIIFKAIR